MQDYYTNIIKLLSVLLIMVENKATQDSDEIQQVMGALNANLSGFLTGVQAWAEPEEKNESE